MDAIRILRRVGPSISRSERDEPQVVLPYFRAGRVAVITLRSEAEVRQAKIELRGGRAITIPK